MKNDFILSASILSADFTRLAEEIHQAERAGTDWIHIDVMDGHFVPNLTMGPFIVEACSRITDLPLDVHLMIENPGKLVPDFLKAGADTLSIHIEAGPDIPAAIQEIKAHDCRASLALNPATGVEQIEELLPEVDQVLVMTVVPGYSGQEFMAEVLPKIVQIRALLDRHNPRAQIQVDGGINPDTILKTREAGAEVFAAASAIFKHPRGIGAGVDSLRRSLEK